MGVQRIPKLIYKGNIKNDIVEINIITLTKNINILQLTKDDKVE